MKKRKVRKKPSAPLASINVSDDEGCHVEDDGDGGGAPVEEEYDGDGGGAPAEEEDDRPYVDLGMRSGHNNSMTVIMRNSKDKKSLN